MRLALRCCRYYTPAILELAGIHDKRTALLVALAPAAVNALGTAAGMLCIDRCGRRWAFLPLAVPEFSTLKHHSPLGVQSILQMQRHCIALGSPLA
jgi:hypothetical protein